MSNKIEARLADLKHFRLKEQQELALAKQSGSKYLDDLTASIASMEQQLGLNEPSFTL